MSLGFPPPRQPWTEIIGIASAWIVDAASWIVHSTTSTCLRTEHTALGISVSLIYNGVIIINTSSMIRLQLFWFLRTNPKNYIKLPNCSKVAPNSNFLFKIVLKMLPISLPTTLRHCQTSQVSPGVQLSYLEFSRSGLVPV